MALAAIKNNYSQISFSGRTPTKWPEKRPLFKPTRSTSSNFNDEKISYPIKRHFSFPSFKTLFLGLSLAVLSIVAISNFICNKSKEPPATEQSSTADTLNAKTKACMNQACENKGLVVPFYVQAYMTGLELNFKG